MASSPQYFALTVQPDPTPPEATYISRSRTWKARAVTYDLHVAASYFQIAHAHAGPPTCTVTASLVTYTTGDTGSGRAPRLQLRTGSPRRTLWLLEDAALLPRELLAEFEAAYQLALEFFTEMNHGEVSAITETDYL